MDVYRGSGVRWEARGAARQRAVSRGSPANPGGAPAELHGHAVLSHPRLAGEIMDGNGWQISKEPPPPPPTARPIPCLSLVGRDNIERTEAEQDTPYMIRGFFNLTAGDSTSLSKG